MDNKLITVTKATQRRYSKKGESTKELVGGGRQSL